MLVKFGKIWVKFDWFGQKSKSCIPKNVQSSTAVVVPRQSRRRRVQYFGTFT